MCKKVNGYFIVLFLLALSASSVHLKNPLPVASWCSSQLFGCCSPLLVLFYLTCTCPNSRFSSWMISTFTWLQLPMHMATCLLSRLSTNCCWLKLLPFSAITSSKPLPSLAGLLCFLLCHQIPFIQCNRNDLSKMQLSIAGLYFHSVQQFRCMKM